MLSNYLTSSSFCQDSVFTLSTELYGEVFSCECDITGSVNDNCNQHGGQCSCQPNVVGRMCRHCAAGHYNLTKTGCKSKYSTYCSLFVVVELLNYSTLIVIIYVNSWHNLINSCIRVLATAWQCGATLQ